MEAYSDILLVLAREAPAAVAVIVVVFMFLRSMKQQARDQQTRLMAAAQECHDTQNRGTEALVKNAEAGAALAATQQSQSEALLQLTIAVTKCMGPSDD